MQAELDRYYIVIVKFSLCPLARSSLLLDHMIKKFNYIGSSNPNRLYECTWGIVIVCSNHGCYIMCRSNFVPGCVVPRNKIAFSDPTPDGKAFAVNYCRTQNFLVYRWLWCLVSVCLCLYVSAKILMLCIHGILILFNLVLNWKTLPIACINS